jgi:hypothetical protein
MTTGDSVSPAAVITVAVILLLLQPAVPVGALEGMLTYNNLSRGHSEEPQKYAQTPPAGGVHSAAWQNCGVYDQPERNENAVHSLEHGAVWLAYRPDLPASAIETLRRLARGHGHVLLAPYPDLPAHRNACKDCGRREYTAKSAPAGV